MRFEVCFRLSCLVFDVFFFSCFCHFLVFQDMSLFVSLLARKRLTGTLGGRLYGQQHSVLFCDSHTGVLNWGEYWFL